MPSLLQYLLEQILVVLQRHLDNMSRRMSLVRHLYKDRCTQAHELADVDVPVHLGELGEGVVHHMLALE